MAIHALKVNNGYFLLPPRQLIRHQLLSTTPTSGPPGGLLKLIDTSDLD